MHDRESHGAVAPVASPLLRPPAALYLAIYYALAAGYWIFYRSKIVDMWSEDLPVYAHAVHNWLSGGNPYDAAIAPLYFLYPPSFLCFAELLSYLVPAHWGSAVYTVASVTATCALPLVLARYFFPRPWLNPLFALLLFFASPRFTGVLALCTMNIASLLYCLAFVAAIPGLRRNRWWWFYGAVFVAATIKITFLALLLLPLLAGQRQWIRSISCGLAVVGANAFEMLFWPQLYAGYRWSLLQGIVKEGAYGYGIFGIVAAYGYKVKIPTPAGAYAAAIVLALAVVALLLFLRRRMDKFTSLGYSIDPETQSAWIALVVTAIVLVNPRQLQYDADISLFTAYVLWVYWFRTRRLLLLMVVLFVPSLLVPLVIKAIHQYGMYGTIETLVVFGLVCWRIGRQTRLPRSDGEQERNAGPAANKLASPA